MEQKSKYFNDHLNWEEYLDDSLGKLDTNSDDGYLNSKGQRLFYSYIREVGSTTRANVTGFGIELHYTIVVLDNQNGNYGFIVENVYPNSPAAKQGIKRGDIITMINNSYITPQNYVGYFNNIQQNRLSKVDLQLRRRATEDKDKQHLSASLTKESYAETTVIHNEIIDIADFDKRIGYLVYTGFESEYDEELLTVLRNFAAEGVQELILDLRCNGGGAVNSAVKLCSALMPNSYEGGALCTIKRNPRNTKHLDDNTASFNLSNTGEILSLKRLTVICSVNSASASELVVMGMRGLDFPVTLIGTTTQGKNCGMDVTRRTIGSTQLEYAPITFMCFNAKGFGDWGEGIVPDIDLSGNNKFGVSDNNYPLPATDWGDHAYDIGLATALAEITGKGLSFNTNTRASADLSAATTMEQPIKGICLYHDDEPTY